MNEDTNFEVTDHYELPERGAFVIGHIRSGMFRIGMVLYSPFGNSHFTISGIECVDNIRERKNWNALTFQERPALATLKVCFPVGAMLKARDRDSQQASAGAGGARQRNSVIS